MRRTILFFTLCLMLASCAKENNFSYDRKTACKIDYGHNGISVIVDKENVLVRNNRQQDYGSTLSVRTADKVYYTMGRYFSSLDSINMLNSLANSSRVYLQWRKPGDRFSVSPPFTNVLNTTTFGQDFERCVKNQQKFIDQQRIFGQ